HDQPGRMEEASGRQSVRQSAGRRRWLPRTRWAGEGATQSGNRGQTATRVMLQQVGLELANRQTWKTGIGYSTMPIAWHKMCRTAVAWGQACKSRKRLVAERVSERYKDRVATFSERPL
ncbi:MAG: hypothetical protein ACRD9W_06835, partial [Terriglobia bacterium]